MLYPTLFLLFAFGGVSGEDNDCQQQIWHKCDVTDVPSQIPDTMEDLKRDCEIVREAVKCAAEENENCEIKVFKTAELMKLHNFMDSNCNEESSLYQALSLHYECIQPIAKNLGNQCYLSEEDWTKMIDLLSTSEELSETAKLCRQPLYEITCTAHIIGMHCGQQAKETVTDIMQNTRYTFRNCNEETILRELQPLKEAFESTFTQALELENAILKEIKEGLTK